jgi:hypothetical protein
MNKSNKIERPIIYLIVIGFHHKKGCQVEFVYPSDERIQKIHSPTDSSSDLYVLPKKWKHLPSLALPDGSHNYETDYIYFHLEDDDGDEKENHNDGNQSENNSIKTKRASRTVFGVSCYRQINAAELINKDSDVTRNTLQKSVCILTRLPIYSSIRLKLYSITTAYFEQKDFSKTDLLISAYQSLLQQTSSFETGLLTSSSNITNHHKLLNQDDKSKYFIGLSLGDLVLKYQHKILILFKLLLLQKKCLFQIKPVSNLSNTIISLVSLIPDIFLPSHTQNSQHTSSNLNSGLDYCSGFFDSMDLVNYELEHKNSKRNEDDSNFLKNNSAGFSFSLTSEYSKKNKKIKKKLKSFSKKHYLNANGITTTTSPHHHHLSNTVTGHAASSASLLTPSFSSNSIKKISTEPGNLDDNNKLDQDQDVFRKSKLDLKSNVYYSNGNANNKQSMSSSSNEDILIDSNPNQIGELIKSRVSNVFRLVDWSSPNPSSPSFSIRSSGGGGGGITNGGASDLTLDSPMNEIDSKKQSAATGNSGGGTIESNSTSSTTSSHRRSLRKSFKKKIDLNQSNSDLLQQKNTAYNNNSLSTSSLPATTTATEIQFNDLLDIDFGSPFNVFNEFNILHPYLSLYYLEYFTMINKMNTKLFCTTALMMSMMKDNKENGGNNSNDAEKEVENDDEESSYIAPQSGGLHTGNLRNGQPRKTTDNKPEPVQIGYTIGATNALFKQRLYDDLDAFIDEMDIDFHGNEQLKKQLQLTTADLRFIDFIVKNVNAAKNVNNNEKQNTNTPTLLSFKKINSTNNLSNNNSKS